MPVDAVRCVIGSTALSAVRLAFGSVPGAVVCEQYLCARRFYYSSVNASELAAARSRMQLITKRNGLIITRHSICQTWNGFVSFKQTWSSFVIRMPTGRANTLHKENRAHLLHCAAGSDGRQSEAIDKRHGLFARIANSDFSFGIIWGFAAANRCPASARIEFWNILFPMAFFCCFEWCV